MNDFLLCTLVAFPAGAIGALLGYVAGYFSGASSSQNGSGWTPRGSVTSGRPADPPRHP